MFDLFRHPDQDLSRSRIWPVAYLFARADGTSGRVLPRLPPAVFCFDRYGRESLFDGLDAVAMSAPFHRENGLLRSHSPRTSSFTLSHCAPG